jgi:dihydroxy-acid dehydratase
MLTGAHRGERVGACTDCPRYWARFRAGEIDEDEIADVNGALVASVGTCSVMGTASTIARVAEALGMTVPGGASRPRSPRIASARPRKPARARCGWLAKARRSTRC